MSDQGQWLSEEDLQQRANPDHEPDLFGEHIITGIEYLHMTDADKDEMAEIFGISRAEYDRIWERRAKQWTEGLDRSDLTPEQYRALFDEEKPNARRA